MTAKTAGSKVRLSTVEESNLWDLAKAAKMMEGPTGRGMVSIVNDHSINVEERSE